MNVNILFPIYDKTPDSFDLNKYVIAIDISNNFDSNNLNNHDSFGGAFTLELCIEIVAPKDDADEFIELIAC